MRIYLLFVLFFPALASMAAGMGSDERDYRTQTHVVQPKETLYKISRQHGVSMLSIKKANKLTSDIIAAGARLTVKIPKENDIFQVHIVRVSQNLEQISEMYQMPMDILTKYNELDENVIFPGQRIFIKIDKISTKYTYAGEEDLPLTDAEAGETGYTLGPDKDKPVEASAGDNPTPVFTYNGAIKRDEEKKADSAEAAKNKAFTIEAYADVYYAQFSDKKEQGALSDYAMSAPKHNQMGLNTVQLAALYNDSNLRGNITLQYGDLPTAAYPAEFRIVQQANMGFRIGGRWWMDAGFFRSPVSVEDFSNRSAYSSLYTYTRYFEPVLYSGAKLGWEAKNVKISGFVSDRSFSINQPANANFSYGLNVKIYSGKYWMTGANLLVSKVAVNNRLQDNIYGNLFVATNRKHMDILAYANYGTRGNKAVMSGVLNIRYKIATKFAVFARSEYFTDTAGMVSPLMTGTDGHQQGLSATAIGGGFEFKARPNHYLRIEARNTQLGSNYKIYNDYFNGGQLTNQRWEFVVTTGIWFGK